MHGKVFILQPIHVIGDPSPAPPPRPRPSSSSVPSLASVCSGRHRDSLLIQLLRMQGMPDNVMALAWSPSSLHRHKWAAWQGSCCFAHASSPPPACYLSVCSALISPPADSLPELMAFCRLRPHHRMQRLILPPLDSLLVSWFPSAPPCMPPPLPPLPAPAAP